MINYNLYSKYTVPDLFKRSLNKAVDGDTNLTALIKRL